MTPTPTSAAAALIQKLQRLEDPEKSTQQDWDNLDWRTFAGTCWRALAAQPAAPAVLAEPLTEWDVRQGIPEAIRIAEEHSKMKKDGFHLVRINPDFLLRVLTATTHPASQARSPLTTEQLEVLKFLYGAGNIRGAGYGTAPEGERAPFWWRRDLAAAFPEIGSGGIGSATTGAKSHE